MKLFNTRNQLLNECSVEIPEDSKRTFLKIIDEMEEFFSNKVESKTDRFSKHSYNSLPISEDKTQIPHQLAVVKATNLSFYGFVEGFSTLKNFFQYTPDYSFDKKPTPDLEINLGWTPEISNLDTSWPRSSIDSSSSGKIQNKILFYFRNL